MELQANKPTSSRRDKLKGGSAIVPVTPPRRPKLKFDDEADADPLFPAAVAAKDYFGVTRRTLSRWVADETLDFPEPVLIRDRWYFFRSKLQAFRIARARCSSDNEGGRDEPCLKNNRRARSQKNTPPALPALIRHSSRCQNTLPRSGQ